MKLDNLNFTGTAVTLRRTELEATSVLKKLNGVYDEHAKLVFLFDVSGSMSCRIADVFTENFSWSPELLGSIRTRAAAAIAEYNRVTLDPVLLLAGSCLSPDEEKLVALGDNDWGPRGERLFNPKDDEDLKQRVVRHDLTGILGVPINWEKHGQKPPTRIEVVKKLAKSEIANRFKKFPDSKVTVIPFGDSAKVLFDGGAPEDLWSELDRLTGCMDGCGGGTNILAAIKKGVETCRANPSTVGVHHFIVVSDGEDGVADSSIESWVPSLKASGVVLDYIHIGDTTQNAGLKAACAALGGEFASVTCEKDFESKFVEAISRKLLPSA
jgi:hypothetical protein